MDTSKVAGLEKVTTAEFLLNDDFGVELSQSSNSEVCDFRNRCREVVDHLVNVLLAQHAVSADFSSGIYCFCPELLLEGDDQRVFQLFCRVVRVLEKSGSLTPSVAWSSVEEFTTFVVDIRRRHVESGMSAENISDVVK